MPKTLFDISTTEDSIDGQQCRLVMEVGQHIFSYAVIGAGKRLLRLRFHELDAPNARDLKDMLEEIIVNDDLLKERMKECVVIYNFPENHLVPEKYFNINITAGLIELMHGDLNRGVILSEKVSGSSQYNVFRVPADIHGLFQRHFTRGKYWHYYSLWMECGQKLNGQREDGFAVIFYPRRILVEFTNNKQVQLFQSFEYEAAEDVAWYLLNLCRQFDKQPETIPVSMSGMIDESSTLYNEILKYFGKAELEPFAIAGGTPAALEEFPPHFFSPLLKLATCVS
jgi:hypothetical protein